MKILLTLDYAAEVLHLCYILLTATFRLTLRLAVFTYVLGQTVGSYYHSLSEMTFTIQPSNLFVANHPLYLDGRRPQFHPAMSR